MFRGEVSVVINRPVEEVFAFVSNYENITQWRTAVVEMRKITEGPVGVGTRYREVGQFLGRRREAILEITEYEPNKKLGTRVTGTPIGAIEGTYTFEAEDGGTRVVESGQAEPDGFFRLIQPLVRWATFRQLNADNGRLKRLLEAQA